MKFGRKSYARIYTDKEENIEKIRTIIKRLDEFEFGYLPNDLIAVYDGKIELVYNHKFDDLDLKELMDTCWNAGIHMFVVD